MENVASHKLAGEKHQICTSRNYFHRITRCWRPGETRQGQPTTITSIWESAVDIAKSEKEIKKIIKAAVTDE